MPIGRGKYLIYEASCVACGQVAETTRRPISASNPHIAQLRASSTQVAKAVRASGPIDWNGVSPSTLREKNGATHQGWLIPFVGPANAATLTYMYLVGPANPKSMFAVVQRLQRPKPRTGGPPTLSFYEPSGAGLGTLTVATRNVEILRVSSASSLGVDLRCLFNCPACFACSGPNFYFCYKECL